MPGAAVELEVRAAMTLYTFPFNALGWPALAIGNVQLAGRPGADALVLGAGLALERVFKS
jgi:Asp-tRNA(Asn)/Glu-tRNA(Gln) amidotransferase A subunit family amidase